MYVSLPLLAGVAVLELVALGLIGLLVTRNLIKVVVGMQVLVKGAMIALVLAGKLSGQIQTGQTIALTVIVADTIVSVVALAFAVQVRRAVRHPGPPGAVDASEVTDATSCDLRDSLDRHPLARRRARLARARLAPAPAAHARRRLRAGRRRGRLRDDSRATAETNVLDVPLGRAFGSVTFLPDGLAVFLAVVATVIGSLAVIFSVDYMRGEKQLGRYYAYVLFFIGAMVGLVLSSNLLLMFVFWEITALCSYALISFYNDDPKAVAAGVKALIITQVGGVGLLAGALLLYAYQGNYDVPTFLANHGALPANVLALMAFGFLVAAAAKSAQFPFQTWLPDAMEAPTPISALIHAATMVNAGVYLLARFYPAFEAVPHWREAVVAVGAITALMAALMAIVSQRPQARARLLHRQPAGLHGVRDRRGRDLRQPVPPASATPSSRRCSSCRPARSSTASARATCARWAASASRCRSCGR